MPWKCPGGGAVAERERERGREKGTTEEPSEYRQSIARASHQGTTRSPPGRPTRASPGDNQGILGHSQGTQGSPPGRSQGISTRKGRDNLAAGVAGCLVGWVPVIAWLPGSLLVAVPWWSLGGAVVVPW